MTSKLTVIITAFQRKKFILDAIDSLLRSSEPPDEIIVVKDYRDEQIDSKIKDIGGIGIIEPSPSLGLKHLDGIKHASGDIIAFLEDDDLFLREKTEILREVFTKNDVDFFHNGLLLINEEGREMSPRKEVTHTINYFSRDQFLKYKYLKYILKKYHPDMYNSCTAISRRLALDCIDGLKYADINVERYWFLCALEKAKVMAMTSDPLTLYRVHTDSASKTMATYSDKGLKLMLAYVNSYDGLMAHFTNKQALNLLKEYKLLHIAQFHLFYRYRDEERWKILLGLLTNMIRPHSMHRRYSLLLFFSILTDYLREGYGRNLYHKVMKTPNI